MLKYKIKNNQIVVTILISCQLFNKTKLKKCLDNRKRVKIIIHKITNGLNHNLLIRAISINSSDRSQNMKSKNYQITKNNTHHKINLYHPNNSSNNNKYHIAHNLNNTNTNDSYHLNNNSKFHKLNNKNELKFLAS